LCEEAPVGDGHFKVWVRLSLDQNLIADAVITGTKPDHADVEERTSSNEVEQSRSSLSGINP
jgi:hypothetical protein